MRPDPAALIEEAREAFAKLDEMATQTRRVADAVEYEEGIREPFSHVATALAVAGDTVTIEAAPDQGELWHVSGVAVRVDPVARTLVIDLGMDDRVLGVMATSATGWGTVGGFAGGDLRPFRLPRGASVRAVGGALAGTRCVLHVWGEREIAND